MKTYALFFFLFVCSILITAHPLRAQDTIPAPPCRQVEVATDATKRHVLEEFIHECERNFRFVNNKGIVQLNIYQNKEGLTCWHLIPHIDDQYKDNPPPAFCDFDGDIILVYPADANGAIAQMPNPAPLAECLDTVIGNRVYVRTTRKDRWGTPYSIPGVKRVFKEGKHRDVTGNGGDVIIIFQKNGSYKKMYPA